MKILIGSAILLVSGCAVMPDSIPVSVEHISHTTQHAPFTNHPTNFGYNVVEIGARWNMNGIRFTISEGFSKEEMDHTHELFMARAEYDFKIRK